MVVIFDNGIWLSGGKREVVVIFGDSDWFAIGKVRAVVVMFSNGIWLSGGKREVVIMFESCNSLIGKVCASVVMSKEGI